MYNITEMRKHLHYCAETGEFTRLIPQRNVLKGTIAGCISRTVQGKEYIKIGVIGRYFMAHQLAFLYMEGRLPPEIDHIDGDGLNNTWVNLREVTHKENGKNQKKYVSNTSGVTGVHLRSNSKWRARIYHEGKHINLGNFRVLGDAVNARRQAEVTYGFHRNHGV